MSLPIYLAMTGKEFTQFRGISSTLCYLSCHFSPNGAGLSNIPINLPSDCILCIDDSTPIVDHSKEQVQMQIKQIVDRFCPGGILLDFQRPNNPYTSDMIDCILGSVDCPVSVSHIYAKEHCCPVFVPPLPYRSTIAEHLANWSDREIWLEIGNDMEMAVITENGFRTEWIDAIPEHGTYFKDASLLCHYCTHINQDNIALYFHRTKEDLAQLQEEAAKLGVTKFIGLWQQLQQFYL